MTRIEMMKLVRCELEAAIRATREGWDAAHRIEEITGYDDVVSTVNQLAAGLRDDEELRDEDFDYLLPSASEPDGPTMPS